MFSDGLIHPEAKESDTYNYKLLEKRSRLAILIIICPANGSSSSGRLLIKYVLAVEIIYG